MFSARTSWNHRENRLSLAVRAARAKGDLLDLTESNPTTADLYDTRPLVRLLGRPEGTRYEPMPFGHPAARAAVSDYYARRGQKVSPEQVILTASTSEAYGYLFTLLCDAKDRVLVPRPSYPLFDWLAATHEVVLEPYALADEERFGIDMADLDRALAEPAHAIVVVHPNNPTGTFVREGEARALVDRAKERKVALIVDEVFGDHATAEAPADVWPSFVGTVSALTFVLSGLSKVALLPQVKVGWIVVSGPDDLVREAMARLEIIADTYLSVSTPAQLALPEILARAPETALAASARIRTNLEELDRALAERSASAPVRRLPVAGGWSVILEIPRLYDDEAWALLLLERDRVLVQPGYFDDLRRQGTVVLSLLPPPATFAEAVGRILSRVAAECSS